MVYCRLDVGDWREETGAGWELGTGDWGLETGKPRRSQERLGDDWRLETRTEDWSEEAGTGAGTRTGIDLEARDRKLTLIILYNDGRVLDANKSDSSQKSS